MKSRQGVSKARVTKPQLEVLGRMAAGESLATTRLRRGPKGGTFGIRYVRHPRPKVGDVAPKKSWGKLLNAGLIERRRGVGFVYDLTPAGRALVEDSRGAK